MALISCPECETRVSDKAVSCPSCGCPIAKPAPVPRPIFETSTPSPATITVAKSRGIYIILGILFGYLGFHNFYSGHYLSGAIKLGIFMLAFVLDAATGFYSAFSLVALVVFELWAIVEIIVVKTDGAENEMS